MELADWIASRAQEDIRDEDVLGWAWATVDLERSVAESGIEPGLWGRVDDQLLGARGVRLRESDPAVLLLEPSTEGRLAGWLARHGEGEAAVYREGGEDEPTDRLTGTALAMPGTLDRQATPGDRRLIVLVATGNR